MTQGGIAYVVSGGYLSAFSVDARTHQLKKLGVERLPAAPEPPRTPSLGFSGGY